MPKQRGQLVPGAKLDAVAGSEIREYLDHLERTKFLAPFDSDLDIEDLDEEIDS